MSADAAQRTTSRTTARRARAVAAAGAHALDQQHGHGRSSVIAAPPISIRCVGPQSVTSWPKSRCQMSSSGKPSSENAPQAQISTPPSGAYQSRGDPDARSGRGFVLRQDDREEAGGEDAEQADEDEVVRRVGQRARVAALVDVQGDVPVHAEQRDEQRDRRRRPEGSAAQPGRPETRSAKRGERGRASATLAACGGRGRATAATTVTIIAPAVAIDDLARCAAPPAGLRGCGERESKCHGTRVDVYTDLMSH